MRKLLNTLFVLTPECYLSLDGETVVVHRDKAEMARFPLHTLEGILSFTYAGASPALMGACARRGVDLAFLLPTGVSWPVLWGKSGAMCCCANSNTA